MLLNSPTEAVSPTPDNYQLDKITNLQTAKKKNKKKTNKPIHFELSLFS